MQKILLLPPFFKYIGIPVALSGMTLSVLNIFYEFQLSWLNFRKAEAAGSIGQLFETTNYTGSAAYLLAMVGLVMVGFSRLHTEDERTVQLRLSTLSLSVYISLGIFVLLTLFVFSLSYILYATMLWFCFLLLFCILFYGRMWLMQSIRMYEEPS